MELSVEMLKLQYADAMQQTRYHSVLVTILIAQISVQPF